MITGRVHSCVIAVCAGLLALVAVSAIASAQTPGSPFGVTGTQKAQPDGAAAKQRGPGAARGITAGRTPPKSDKAPSTLQRAWVWLVRQQQKIHRQLAAAVRSLKTGDIVTSTAFLAFLSFAYGVLHAAGPGHGKAVISSYVLANERTVRRGIALSFLAALVQALSAIVIVGVLAVALNATSLKIKATEHVITSVSWALVAAIGAWLLVKQLRALFVTNSQPAIAGHPAHDEAGHVHGPDCGCAHAHMPSPDQVSGKWSWANAFAIAFAVGIRPCTGAIIVLVFALSQGLYWAGVFATFAMAIGTAITVSTLAALAVGSRELATRLAGDRPGWVRGVQSAAGLVGATLVFGLGTAFFLASLSGGAAL